MRLYLIRHPQPEIVEGFCYGRSDLPLRSPWSAQSIASMLPDSAAVVSSPLRRCADFARALSADVRLDERMVELDFGHWEMLAWDDIDSAQLDAWATDPLDYTGHGGESVAQMQLRVRAALADLGPDDCVWVTHGGVMKLVFAELLNLPQTEWLELRFDYGSLSIISIEGGQATLEAFNQS